VLEAVPSLLFNKDDMHEAAASDAGAIVWQQYGKNCMQGQRALEQHQILPNGGYNHPGYKTIQLYSLPLFSFTMLFKQSRK